MSAQALLPRAFSLLSLRRPALVLCSKMKVRAGLSLVQGSCSTGAHHAAPLQREEVCEELLAGVGEDGLGVELDAFNLVPAVAEAHDDAVIGFGGDGKLVRQRFLFDNE